MGKQVIYKSDYITFEHWVEKGMIYHTVHKPIEVPQLSILREGLNKGTETLKKHELTKWLSDDRKNGPLPKEQIEWASTYWSPQTIGAGWKYWANVVPQDLISAGALTPLINDLAQHGLRMMVFNNIDEAVEWLDKR